MGTLNRRLPIALAVALLFAAEAPAQIARVFLSGTGDDLNDCSNAGTPCRSLQGAVNQCPVNGEIIVMTSGGFGTATISQSLTINAPTGVVAFNARTITVNIGFGDLVTIRGLSMNGAVYGDTYGIDFNGSGGTLVVENSVIAGFQVGINTGASVKLMVHHSELRNNSAYGMAVGGSAVTVEDSRFENNGQYGLYLYGGRGAVLSSVSTGNGTADFDIRSNVGGPVATLLIDRCIASKSANGIRVDQNGTAAVTVRVTNSTITGNTTGLAYIGTGTITSYGTNQLWSNGTDGAFTAPNAARD